MLTTATFIAYRHPRPAASRQASHLSPHRSPTGFVDH